MFYLFLKSLKSKNRKNNAAITFIKNPIESELEVISSFTIAPRFASVTFSGKSKEEEEEEDEPDFNGVVATDILASLELAERVSLLVIVDAISMEVCCTKTGVSSLKLFWEKLQNVADKKNITLKKIVLYFFIFYYLKNVCALVYVCYKNK